MHAAHAAQPQPHSPAWLAQVWISFAVSLGATVLGANVSGYLGAHEVMHTVSDVPNVSLGDFLPGIASWKDFREMQSTCGY